jgi:hypothetical protein
MYFEKREKENESMMKIDTREGFAERRVELHLHYGVFLLEDHSKRGTLPYQVRRPY